MKLSVVYRNREKKCDAFFDLNHTDIDFFCMGLFRSYIYIKKNFRQRISDFKFITVFFRQTGSKSPVKLFKISPVGFLMKNKEPADVFKERTDIIRIKYCSRHSADNFRTENKRMIVTERRR